MSKSKKKGVSLGALAIKLGCDQATVRKWVKVAGIKPVRSSGAWNWYDEKQVRDAVKPHLVGREKHNTTPNVDPKSGLTWHQKKLKEEARRIEMENDRAAKLLSNEIMLTADHHRILSALISGLDRVTGKVASEQGLSPAQTLGLRKALDEMREAAAKEVSEME